jgi:hypothetical protein
MLWSYFWSSKLALCKRCSHQTIGSLPVTCRRNNCHSAMQIVYAYPIVAMPPFSENVLRNVGIYPQFRMTLQLRKQTSVSSPSLEPQASNNEADGLCLFFGRCVLQMFARVRMLWLFATRCLIPCDSRLRFEICLFEHFYYLLLDQSLNHLRKTAVLAAIQLHMEKYSGIYIRFICYLTAMSYS